MQTICRGPWGAVRNLRLCHSLAVNTQYPQYISPIPPYPDTAQCPIYIANTYTKSQHLHKHLKFYSYKAVIANQNSILLSNNSKTLYSLNRNTNTILFSSDTNTALALVSHITPKLTSLIHKHACLIDDDKHLIKKGYYFINITGLQILKGIIL